MKKIISLFLSFTIITPSALAQNEVFTMKKAVNNTQEYFAGAYPGTVMMKVNLLGGVNKPGVYNVPVNSELTSVLAYAGGPSKEAEVGEVFVRSKKGSDYEVKKINLENFFKDSSEQPFRLKPDDYIYVKQGEDFINNDVYRTTLLVSTIVGVILTGLLIDRTLKN